ncbi:MAG: hypothetical protein JWN73_2858 [Betaproteobacteria bacterium]|nr:hypothetical protein [Betaproteobacteria bacterium]
MILPELPRTSVLLLACALALPVLAQAALNAYKVEDAQGRQFSGELVGNKLFLLDKGQKSPAPDGSYKIDGSVRQVRNGMLVPAVRGEGPGNSLRPGGKQSDESPKE